MPDVVGDIIRVTSAALFPVGSTGQQVQEWNVCYQCTATGGTDTRAAVGIAVNSANVAQLLPVLSSDAIYYGTLVSALGKYPPPLSIPHTVVLPGTGAGTQIPTQARGLISWRTAFGGRASRGRVYMPSPTAANNDGHGSPAGAYTTALGSWASSIRTAVSSAGSTWGLVIAHRGAGPKPPYTATPVTAASVRGSWASQRRSGEFGRVNADPW